MRRRLWSLLVLFLLALATQASADDGDDDRDDRDDGDGRHGRDDNDDRDDDGDDGGARDRDDEDDDRDDARDGKGKKEGKEKDGERKQGKERKETEARAGGRAPPTRADDAHIAAPPTEPAAPASSAPLLPPVGPADAGVTMLPTVLPGRVTFTFLVSAGGPLDDAHLTATLPEATAWTVTGPGVSACDLAGAELACTFRGLAAGDVQLVQATALLREAPPWELVAHATVSASGDPVPGNDAASAAVGLLLA